MMASQISAFVARSAAMSATLVLLASVPAAAEVHMSGTREALRLDGGGAPLQEVLEALHRRYGISVRGAAGIERTVTATYTGSLPQVIARLLHGQNFIVRSSDGDLDVVILGSGQAVRAAGGPAAIAAPLPQPAAQTESTPAGNWRDGDGNLIAPPARSAQVAPAKAAATWTDGDGNQIAPPGGKAAQ